MKEKFAARIKEKTMAEWTAIFDGTDACVAPVRRFDDALTDAHNSARNSFVRVDGIVQPAPAPRFSRTVGLDRPRRGRARRQHRRGSRRMGVFGGRDRRVACGWCRRLKQRLRRLRLAVATVLGDAAGWSSRRLGQR